MNKIEKLEALGGKRWKKGSMDRIYFNVSLKDLKIETSAYGKTGDKEGVYYASRSKASVMSQKDIKVWYDVAKESWESKGEIYTYQCEEGHVARYISELEAKTTDAKDEETISEASDKKVIATESKAQIYAALRKSGLDEEDMWDLGLMSQDDAYEQYASEYGAE